MTFDRILDVYVKAPPKKSSGKGKGKAKMDVDGEEDEEEEEEERISGVRPADGDMIHIDEWEKKVMKKGYKADESVADLVVWCYVKVRKPSIQA